MCKPENRQSLLQTKPCYALVENAAKIAEKGLLGWWFVDKKREIPVEQDVFIAVLPLF
jgi:hypothetical protein